MKKKNAFMEAWLAFKEQTDAQDREFAVKQTEIGRAGAGAVVFRQSKSFSSGRFCCDSWNFFAAPDKRPHDEPDQANHNQYSRISRSEHARYFL